MPELRQNPITKDWVIIAPERSKRPDQFTHHKAHEEVGNGKKGLHARSVQEGNICAGKTF